MRFESKNKGIKGFASNCFKNVPFSVSVRHQQMSCHLLAVRPGQEMSNFLYKGDEVSSGKVCVKIQNNYYVLLFTLNSRSFKCKNS